MKKLLKPTLLALSLAIITPNIALASGIPTVDAAGIATTIAENVKTLAQLKEQLDAMNEQINQAKQFANDTKKRFEGNWNLGDLVANDDFLRGLPKAAQDILTNNIGNIVQLRNQYGLKSDNTEIQGYFDSLIKYTERTKQAYENLVKRNKNLERIKRLADAATTPAQKQDVANQFAYEKLKFDQEQQAIKQFETSIKAQQEIDNELYLKSIKERFNKAVDYTK
ncbi:type IV secretion system protein [Avibacterium paragallinarum]|uniref:Uncharacterized protein n=1 Tax=Avibacterium paragallinarum TaxID=728 RepID=A0ABU7QS74_AVIPA|nr:type IV secretion system protein [Avibacterium paragallinarum]